MRRDRVTSKPWCNPSAPRFAQLFRKFVGGWNLFYQPINFLSENLVETDNFFIYFPIEGWYNFWRSSLNLGEMKLLCFIFWPRRKKKNQWSRRVGKLLKCTSKTTSDSNGKLNWKHFDGTLAADCKKKWKIFISLKFSEFSAYFPKNLLRIFFIFPQISLHFLKN